MSEVNRVRVDAGLADDDASLLRADVALGQALSGVIQAWLSQHRDEWDVELFFENYGRPPRDGSSWSQAVLGALAFRTDISDADREIIIGEGRMKAVADLSTAS